MTFSAETDGVIECALHYGRKLEVFVAVGDKVEEVAKRMEEAWEAPWREGKFTVSTTEYIHCFSWYLNARFFCLRNAFSYLISSSSPKLTIRMGEGGGVFCVSFEYTLATKLYVNIKVAYICSRGSCV